MAARDRPVDRAATRAQRDLVRLGQEARIARLMAGLGQAQVGRAAGRTAPQVSRFERGLATRVDLVVIAKMLAATGLDLSVRGFPAGEPIRDVAHVALLKRVRQRLGPGWTWHLEVPVMPGGDDGRAWDAVASLSTGVRVGIEAETRLHDVQAQLRRVTTKACAGTVDRLILAVADTHLNRRILAQIRPLTHDDLPLGTRATLAALAAGRDPGANGVIVL